MKCWLLAMLVATGACKSSDGGGEPKATPDSPTEAKVEPAAKPPVDAASQATTWKPLRYKVNDKHVEVEHLGDDFALLDVKELPPVKEWKTLIVRNIEGREFTGTKPILLTGIRTMRVVTLPSGAFEFRVIEPVTAMGDGGLAKTRIRHKMTNAKSIIIHTKDYEPPPPPKPVSVLLMKSGDSEIEFDRETMDAIERNPEPGAGEGRDTWELIALLKAAKLEPTRSIRLTNGLGKTLELASEEFQSNKNAHMIKRNRRGQFNYRHWSLKPSPKRVGELRGVVSIELL